jgi:hypothetical protein
MDGSSPGGLQPSNSVREVRNREPRLRNPRNVFFLPNLKSEAYFIILHR